MEIFEMWLRRETEKINWREKTRNKQILGEKITKQNLSELKQTG